MTSRTIKPHIILVLVAVAASIYYFSTPIHKVFLRTTAHHLVDNQENPAGLDALFTSFAENSETPSSNTDIQLQPSTGPLKLVGIIYHNDDSKAQAILSIDGASKAYPKKSVLPNGASIIAISHNYVTIRHNGKNTNMTLTQ